MGSSPPKPRFFAPIRRRRFLERATTVVATLALMTSSAYAAEASAVLQPQPTSQPKPLPAKLVTERPDRVSAALSARLQGSRVLITGETTESNLTYANPDSTFTTEAVSGIARVKQDERWVPVDTTLIEENGVLRPRAAKAVVEVSAGGQDRPLAKMSHSDKQSFALKWPIALPKPNVKGNVATYANAAGPNADLVVTVLPAGFRHDVVLRERPTGPVEFKIPVQAEGLTLGMTKQGGLKLTTSKGKVVASAPKPFMYDSPAGETPQSTDAAPVEASITTSVKVEDGQQMLVLKPDPDFLTDPETQYPVTVDPTTTLTLLAARTLNSACSNGYAGETTSWNLTPGIRGNGDQECGYAANGSRLSRGLIKFDTSSLSGQQVVDARLELFGDLLRCPVGQSLRVRRLTSNWDPDEVFWSNQPTSTSDGETTSAPPAVCGPTSYTENTPWSMAVTAIAKAWAGGAASHGLVLAPSNEQDRSKTFGWHFKDSGVNAPKLVVTYGSTPWIAGPLRAQPVAAVNNNVYTNTHTPTLVAGVHDADGGLLRAEFEIEHDPSVSGQGSGLIWSGSVDNVSAGTDAKIAVPAGKLSDGWKVRWRARASDASSSSAWSQWQILTVDATVPKVTQISCTYPVNTWSGQLGNAECGVYTEDNDPIDSDDKGTNDPTEILWGLDDPSTPNVLNKTWGYSQGQKSIWFKIDPRDGWRTLYAKVRDKAHNTSTVTTYSFGVGPGGLVTKKNRTQRSVMLSAAAPSERTQVRYEYGGEGYTPYGSFDDEWLVVPPADVTPPGSSTPITSWPQPRSDTSKNFSELSWDIAKTFRNAGRKDGAVGVRACFSGGAAGEVCSKPITVTLDRSAFGSSYATANIGPGSVALQTGDFSLKHTDASIFGVDVTRTLTSLEPGSDREDEQLIENKVFGPGWRGGFPAVPSWISDFSPSNDGDSGSIQMIGPDGETLTYVREGASFTGYGDAADGSKIIVDSDNGQLIVTDRSGVKTTYSRVNGRWVITKVETTGAESGIVYLRDSQGRVTRILSSVATGITCGTTLVVGCRALDLTYGSSTTATGVSSGWGDYTGLVKQVAFTAFDPDSNAMKTTALASYLYDSTGHLRQVADPRTGLAATYYYTAEGRVSQITPPGLAPWRMEYDSFGRLAHVQREGGEVDPTQAVVYDVPISTPIDLTVGQTSTWGQTLDLPQLGAAIFPASHVPTRNGDGTYQSTVGDWEYGALTYVDVNGRAVNKAAYGAGAWQISTTRYDDKGNVVWRLSPDYRAQALTPTGDTDPYVTGRMDSAERAHLLATTRIFSSDGDLLSETGPAHPVLLASGVLVSARKRVSNTYDEGKPLSNVNYHLVTTSTQEPVVLDGTATPGTNDVRTTKTGYDPIMSGDASGWALRKATTTFVVMAGQSNIIQRVRYDATGGQIERRMPASNGTDAGTALTYYYTAGAHPSVAACGNKPEWTGLTCYTAPAAQPSTGKVLPTQSMIYGYYGNPTKTTETVGAVVRTATVTYDAAGRTIKSKLEVTPTGEGGTAVPEVTYTYDAATGLQTQKAAGGDTITVTYDTFGRPASTTDATGNMATASYNLDGQIATTNDGRGITTFTYNGTDAAGKIERRGLVTKNDANGVGVFTGAYDAAGRLTLQTYPNGLTATNRYDATDKLIGLTYAKNGVTWLNFTATPDVQGRTVIQQGPGGSAQNYSYDPVSRLIKTRDTYAGRCTTRIYGFDINTNRTNLSSYPADSTGFCSTNTTPSTQNYSYDQADRITNSGYVYDAFGRTTQVPTAHVTGGADLTIGYFANSMVASLSQGGQSNTFTLDPVGRVKTMTTNGGSRPGTVTNHYSGTEDSPAWITEANGTWTRNIVGFSGLAAIQKSDGTSTLQLSNLHGDIVATSDNTLTATGVQSYAEQTEFGISRAENTSNPTRYGWLGSKQRSVDALAGLVLMGVRLYNPTTGRFLQVDPLVGGSANAYDYCFADPINCTDLAGTAGNPNYDVVYRRTDMLGEKSEAVAWREWAEQVFGPQGFVIDKFQHVRYVEHRKRTVFTGMQSKKKYECDIPGPGRSCTRGEWVTYERTMFANYIEEWTKTVTIITMNKGGEAVFGTKTVTFEPHHAGFQDWIFSHTVKSWNHYGKWVRVG
ncbi:DNRLRE domain-containing protein [Streptosporangium sp. NPDC000396]|uniref:DNRLRE domain-containing protein n=1 Tax=Streptosporangium sp. NPDC000396 TaxID=3366185 RepID=UPI003693AAE3